MQSRTIKLKPFLDFRDLMEGVRPDLLDIGPYGTLLLPIQGDGPKMIAVCVVTDHETKRIDLQTPLTIGHLQTLSNQRLLLVASRSAALDDGHGEVNAHVVDADGRFCDSFCVGDGISHVKSTRDDIIWVSYFDEGVLGGGDWRVPIGAAGLVAWSPAGEQLYHLSLPPELPRVVDGYALDVSGSDVWFSYYPEFPLVHLAGTRYVNFWRSPVAGAHTMVTHKDRVLYSPGFGKDTHYRLFHLEAHERMRPLASFQLLGHEDEPLHHCRLRARGSRFLLIGQHGIYKLDLDDLNDNFDQSD